VEASSLTQPPVHCLVTFFFFFFFFMTTLGFKLTTQALYYRSHAPSLFWFSWFFFTDRILHFLRGPILDLIPSIFTSCVAGITGTCRHTQLPSSLFLLLLLVRLGFELHFMLAKQVFYCLSHTLQSSLLWSSSEMGSCELFA
jgi:hypothetical protein